ncbi:MAG: hypothetical protein U0640_09280 [Phycisphaerales bacterium]
MSGKSERAMERTSERGGRGARWVRRGFVLLGCGVVVAVGVSWAAALWTSNVQFWKRLDVSINDPVPTEVVTWRNEMFCVEKTSWLASTEGRIGTPTRNGDLAIDWSYFVDPPISIEGSWPLEVDTRSGDSEWGFREDSMWRVPREVICEVRSGWPVAAMRSRRVTDWDDAKFTYVTQCDGLEIPASSLGERMRLTLEGNSLNSPYRPVPLVPVWPGFAVCSVFWAGVVGVVWFVPGMVRGAMRRRRGLCASCAYQVSGLAACPECGTEVRLSEKRAVVPNVSSTPSSVAGGAA